MVLYRAIDTQAIQSQWEGMLLVTYRKTIWVGASYRQDYGLTGFIGMALSSFRAGYAYEHPTSNISKAASASHEIYLGARLGKRDRNEEYLAKRKAKDSLGRIARDKKILTEHLSDSVREVAEAVPEKIIEKVTAKNPPPKDSVVAVMPTEEIKPPPVEKIVPEKEPEEGKMEGYYVVFGAYRKSENAEKQMDYLRQQGLAPQMIYGTEKEYYYVYTFRSSNKETALIELRKVLKDRPFSGAWIFNPKID
jgi:hypothetical protein